MEDKNTDNMENKSEKGCCCHTSKHRSDKEYKDLMNRLSRIEGQVRGIKGMLEKDAYCPEILVQVSAVNAALNSFNKVLRITSVPVWQMTSGTEKMRRLMNW